MLALLASALLQLADPPLGEQEKIDSVQSIRGTSSMDLDWADAEDRMHGTIRPLDPIEGKPLELSVMVGTFQGAEFDGPVTMAVRCLDWQATQTVRRAKGERAWFARFVPEDDGDCSIDLGFTTTRHKLLHSKVYVTSAPLTRLPWYLMIGVLLIGAFGLGLRAIFKKPEQA